MSATIAGDTLVVTLRLPLTVAERLRMVGKHYRVAFATLCAAILCEWVNEHVPYRAARLSNRDWWDRRVRAPS